MFNWWKRWRKAAAEAAEKRWEEKVRKDWQQLRNDRIDNETKWTVKIFEATGKLMAEWHPDREPRYGKDRSLNFWEANVYRLIDYGPGYIEVQGIVPADLPKWADYLEVRKAERKAVKA
jgi:hypothetical protein